MKEEIKVWWLSLSEREQQLSMLGGGFLLLLVIYFGAWKPLSDRLQEGKRQLNNAQHTLTWVEDKAALLTHSGVNKGQIKNSRLTLIQIINRSAKPYDIKFSRIVNKKKQIEVWISDVEFDRFVGWLSTLKNQYSVSVISTDFSKIEPDGHVKINHLLLGK